MWLSIFTTDEKTVWNTYQKRVESPLKANTSLSAQLDYVKDALLLSHDSIVYFYFLICKQKAYEYLWISLDKSFMKISWF